MVKKRVKAIIMVIAPMIATVMLGFMVLVLVLVLFTVISHKLFELQTQLGSELVLSVFDHLFVAFMVFNQAFCCGVGNAEDLGDLVFRITSIN